MQRKDHDSDQLAMYAAAWRETLKPKAKERQRKAGGDKKSANAKSLSATGQKAIEPVHTDKIAADKFGVSSRTVARATNVIKHGCPQLQQAVREDRINLTLAEKVAKTLEGDEQQEAVAVAPLSSRSTPFSPQLSQWQP